MTDNSLEPDLRNQRKAGKDRTEERSPVIRGLNQGKLHIWMELSIKLKKKHQKVRVEVHIFGEGHKILRNLH